MQYPRLGPRSENTSFEGQIEAVARQKFLQKGKARQRRRGDAAGGRVIEIGSRNAVEGHQHIGSVLPQGFAETADEFSGAPGIAPR